MTGRREAGGMTGRWEAGGMTGRQEDGGMTGGQWRRQQYPSYTGCNTRDSGMRGRERMVLLAKCTRHCVREEEGSREKASIYMILAPTLAPRATPPATPPRTTVTFVHTQVLMQYLVILSDSAVLIPPDTEILCVYHTYPLLLAGHRTF